ncbi:unnamed protein product [Boreogadus saida]
MAPYLISSGQEAEQQSVSGLQTPFTPPGRLTRARDMDKNTRGQEKDKRLNMPKPESQSKKKMTTMPKETNEGHVLTANADSDEQPSWVAAFQTSMQTTLARTQVKIDAGRQNMETKLDKISRQMDDALKGVRDEMARRLREEMGQIRTEATRRLESCREENERQNRTC